MSVQEQKAVVRRFVEEFWNQGHVAVADELLSVHATIVLPGMEPLSLDGLKTFALTFRSAFPDWFSTVEALVIDEDRVAEYWTGRGTHRGEFQGIAPTGRRVTVPGFVLYRLASGKITEFRGLFDRLSLMQQLGAIPDYR
jgi:predicted ester cyclase